MKLAIHIPLVVREKKLGVLGLIWSKSDVSPNEYELIGTFANQIISAVYNAGLFNQVKTQVDQLEYKNRDLESLYNLSSKVSQSLDPTTVAQTAVNSLPQDKFILGAVLNEYIKEKDVEKVQMIAYTESAIAYDAVKILGNPRKYFTTFDMEGAEYNITVKAVKQGIPQFTNDLNELLLPSIPKPLANILKGLVPIKSLATYPLKIRNEVIGCLTYFVRDKTVEELSEGEKQLLETYTFHIAIALENAELYKQQQIIQANLQQALREVQALRQHEQDMIDIMGHELRTPISIVRNALGMLELETKTTGSVKKANLDKFLDIALESARREVKLVETLLSSAKADSRGFQLLFEKVDIVDVVNDSLEFFKKEAEKKGLEIKYTKPTEQYFVYCDRTRVQEVMDNFMSNAVKYTDQGFIRITIKGDSKFAWVDINDSGIGISEEDLKQLGKKFYRVNQYMGMDERLTKEKPNIIRPGGTGLGLYVTFSLVKVMDGEIKVGSKLGVGSTFSFGLPLYTDQPTKQEQRKPDQELFKIEPQ